MTRERDGLLLAIAPVEPDTGLALGRSVTQSGIERVRSDGAEQ